MDAIEAVIADLAFERKMTQLWAVKRQAQADGRIVLDPERQHPWSPRHPRHRLRYRPGELCIDCHASAKLLPENFYSPAQLVRQRPPFLEPMELV